jgi:Na+-driven multidrug efflux pump
MFNIANLLVQVKINSFGSTAMAGVAAYTKVDGFVYMPVMALSLATSTFVGQNLGANQRDRAKSGAKIGACIAVCVSAFMGTLVQLVGRQVLHLFSGDEQVIEFGVAMMHVLASFAWTFSPSDILGGAMRGAGAATQVTIINAICICVFRILWLTILLPIYPDIRVVFWCYPASWILCTTCILIYYKKGNWLKNSAIGTAQT